MKKIIFILTIFLLAMHGCEKYPEAPINDIAIADKVEAAARTATISGTVECPVSITKIELWIDTIESGAYPKVYTVEMKNKNFALSVAGLLPITTYYYRYVAYNSVDTLELEEKNFTTIDGTLASITTAEVTQIGLYGAVCGGNISNDGSYDITARGVCWSTQPNPTISNSKTTDGTGTGSFTSNITGLAEGTTYYVRAYATNSKGTAYGEEKSFTTTTIPTVFTNTVTSIKATTLVCGGNVTSDGNATVTERGLCWSTSPNPTINGNKTSRGTGTGSFSITITGLNENTTYYIRAYATNSNGTAYGDTRTAQTLIATMPSVTTANVTSITANSAVCGGNVTSDGNLTVTARGVCWSTSPNPTINDIKTTNGTGTGSFTSNITGLTESTTYYVRAYATNSNGTAYGEERSFTTLATTGIINGHNWVDLGLPSGLKWATCNVGATTPEGYGNYYAWGETTTKTSYNESNSVTYNQQINDFSGNSTYDAARANWGSTWRMPTDAEMIELLNNCTWTWTTQSGVNGYRVTGPNGNSIFLSAAGYCYGSSCYYVGEYGYYWSSTPSGSLTNVAYDLCFNSGYHNWQRGGRYYGFTVRPVSD